MNENQSGPPSTGASATKTFWTAPHLGVAAICALTALAYAGTLRFQFVHDDRGQIVGNPAVHSWHAVPGYFTAHSWAAVAPTFLGNDYRPLFLLWLRINDAIFGNWVAGWHLSTVLAHVLATYWVMVLAHRIFREWPAALFSGLIFGLHPIHIEGVAWISGVPEPLLAALLIPSYLCWVRFRESPAAARRWLGASLVLYTLALLTKETAVVLPIILLIAEWWGHFRPAAPDRRQRMSARVQAIKLLAPFFLLTAVYLAVRMMALRGFSHPAAQIGWLTVVLTWPSLLVFYLRLLLWPVGLNPFYGMRFVLHPTFRNAVLPTMVLVLAALGLWRWGTLSRSIALVVPWLIVPVLPVLDIQVFGDGNFAHNRYLYLPSVGFSMLAAAALRKMKFGRPSWEGVPSSQAVACLALGLLMAFAVQVEDRYYANDATFYSFAYSRMGDHDPVIGMDFANTLAEQGDFDRAAAIYQDIIRSHPGMWNADFNLGYMYYQEGKLESAVQYLTRAAAGDPGKASAVFYLGLADFKLRRLDEAEAHLRRALALAPAAANYHFALGVVLKVEGNWGEAEQEFKRELALNPGHQAAARQLAEIQQHLTGK